MTVVAYENSLDSDQLNTYTMQSALHTKNKIALCTDIGKKCNSNWQRE